MCLPLLIFPCTINSRSSLLALAHPGSPGKKAVKWSCVCVDISAWHPWHEWLPACTRFSLQSRQTCARNICVHALRLMTQAGELIFSGSPGKCPSKQWCWCWWWWESLTVSSVTWDHFKTVALECHWGWAVFKFRMSFCGWGPYAGQKGPQWCELRQTRVMWEPCWPGLG